MASKRRNGLDNGRTVVQIVQETTDDDHQTTPRTEGRGGGGGVENPVGKETSTEEEEASVDVNGRKASEASRGEVELEPNAEHDGMQRDEDDEDYEVKEYERDYQAVLRLKQQMEKNHSNPLHRGNKNIFSSFISPKKPKEWKLMAFVVLLFFLIIIGLALIYHFHEEQFYYIYYGHGVIVNERSLDIKFTDSSGNTVLVGNLWRRRPSHKLPFDCSDVDLKGQELCLLWQHRTRLEIRTVAMTNATCHHVTWMSMSTDVSQYDCFELEDANWYGGGISIGANEWPLEKSSIQKKPFVSGDIHDLNGFGPVLERFWLSSKGVILFMQEPFPIQLSFNSFNSLLNRTDGQLCIHSLLDGRERFSKETTKTQNLSYSVCVAEDVRQVHSITLSQSIGVMRRNSRPPPNHLFEAPIWSTWSYLKDRFNQSQLESFAAEIKSSGFSGRSVFMIDFGWEENLGDAAFDASKFQNPQLMIKFLQNNEFQVSLLSTTLISCNSLAFQQATMNGYLIRDESGTVPGLVRSRQGPRSSAKWTGGGDGGVYGVIDVGTNGTEWLREKLSYLKSKYNIDSFHFNGGEVLSLPANPTFNEAFTDPNDYTKRMVEVLSYSFEDSVFSVQSAYRSQNQPLFIRLASGTSTWNETGGLGTVIPTVLTMGLIGYPFFIPDAVGGGGYDDMPSKELYIRWLQLSVFMPLLHFSIPPFYFDNETSLLAKQLMDVRRKFVLPEISRVVGDATDRLTPLLRPIWWDSPTDQEALKSATEFLVGNSILVAPITTEGARERDVYLPDGVWMDVEHGNIVHRGPKWLYAYSAPLNEVPYFIRK